MPFLRLPHTPVNRLLSSFACSSNLPSALATQPQLPKSAQYRLYSGQFDTSQGVATKENGTLGSPTEVKRVGFGFSAGGLVFPYLVGVAEGLREGGLLTSDSPCAGASAGSLTTCLFLSGLTANEMMEGAIELSENCRKDGTMGRLRSVLEGVLRNVVPQDAHMRCSGKAHVAVTQVFPLGSSGGKLISQFDTREDLIQAMLTSCHVPVWFNRRMFTNYRSYTACDGGVVNFIPGPPSCDRVVRVCCFPVEGWGEKFGVDIAPDSFGKSKYSMGEMLGWAFKPAEAGRLWEFYELGRADALAFVASSNIEIPPVVEVNSSGTSMWYRLRSMWVK